MKTIKLTIVIVVSILIGISINANQITSPQISINENIITESFGVRGNCGMCKATIEKAALGVKGVSKASWNRETKEFTVTYDNNKTNLDAIHNSIAKSGYDTELVTAKSSDYDNLPGCCQYNREMSISKAEEKVVKEKNTQKSCCSSKKSKSCH